ncbi:hypothetical protein [Salinibaculum rarum]|uniref:hypothetical protein n=1 Tax=Salinibaculum rarum TaxID=3058903 RepID=UPI00265E1EDB|nr:hypothetical protein [Salinibaculum sp. KK48]
MAQRNQALFDGEIKAAARERVIDEHELDPDAETNDAGPGVDDLYDAEWMDGFAHGDPENPNHILHHDEVLCDTVDKGVLTVPTKMFKHTRESLLHPKTKMQTPERYCQHCLEKFRELYDFTLDEADLRCPDCGSQAQAVIDPKHGVIKCKRCNTPSKSI